MKRMMICLVVLGTMLAAGLPVRALNQEDTPRLTCQGPAHILLAGLAFEKSAMDETTCAAYYVPQASATQKIQHPWLPWASVSTQLIPQAHEDLRYTLQPFIPSGATLKGFNHQNPDDILSTYQVIKRAEQADELHFLLLRAVRQEDGSAGVYMLDITVTASPKPATGYNERNKGPYERTYDTFNQMTRTYRQEWITLLESLQLEN